MDMRKGLVGMGQGLIGRGESPRESNQNSYTGMKFTKKQNQLKSWLLELEFPSASPDLCYRCFVSSWPH